MRKVSKNLLGTASKTSLILSPCGHWMDKRATQGGKSTIQSEFGTDIHGSIENFLNGRWDGVNPEHIEIYCKPALKFIEDISGCVDGSADPILVEESMFITVDGDTSGSVEDYSALDGMDKGCFAGTADAMVLHDNSRVTIVDWKTGNGFFARDQLRSLGGLAVNVYDAKSVRMISAEVRPNEVKAALDFEESAADLVFALDRVLAALRRGPTLPVVGAHCYEHFCPHRENCTGIQREFFSAKNTEPMDLGLMDDEAIYRMYSATATTIKDAESAKARVLAEARKRGGLKHPGGFFTETFRQVKRVSQEDLIGLAKSFGATDADIDLCRKESRESSGWRNKK